MDRMQIREKLIGTGLVSPSEIRGCSESEVVDLARSVGQDLPRSYCEYLMAIGNGAGRFLAGTDAFLKHVYDVNTEARGMFKEAGVESLLPSNAFVFYGHQGYEFGFFLLGQGDDPPVYQYVEGEETPNLVWGSFSDYLSDVIRIFSETGNLLRDE